MLDPMTDALPLDPDQAAAAPRFRACPWTDLRSPHDVELWIDEHNRSLQEHIGKHETGYGVCFTLTEGGDIFLQTNGDGAIILDVSAEADWVAPLISAASGCAAPSGSLWILPDDKLIELIIGLSSLVATSTLVVGHHFGARRRRAM